MSKKRKKYTAAEKTIILKSSLVDKTPISDICDQYEIHPTLFYRWQKLMFEKMPVALESNRDTQLKHLQQEIDRLNGRLSHKDEVIAEIMGDYMTLKKSHGEL